MNSQSSRGNPGRLKPVNGWVARVAVNESKSTLCAHAFLSRVGKVQRSMLDGSANRICNIMRANECFATGQSIQRTYGLYFIHETPDTGASAPTRPMKITGCRMRYVSKWSCIRARAITCLPAMHWNILNANRRVWKGVGKTSRSEWRVTLFPVW